MRDFDIRILLKKTELSPYFNDGNSKVVEELNLWATGARIDLAVINGHFHGYEIKSAIDTLQRLPNQIEAYSKVFDYLSVVTENNHYGKVYDLLPKWVGLYVCSEKDNERNITEIRKPALNKITNGFFVAKLLWREELIELLREEKIPFRMKDRNWILCKTLSENIEVFKLSEKVRIKLKERPNWKIKPEGYEAK